MLRVESHIDFRKKFVAGEDRRGGVITNDVLKFRKAIEFASSCIIVTCFSYIYQIIHGKDHLSIKKVLKNLRN